MDKWKDIVKNWTGTKKSYRPFENNLLTLFEKAFENTLLPDKSWFGYPPSKNSLGLFFGRLMLVGVFQKTIEIIIDDDISDKINFPTRVVGSSKSSGEYLYWITTDVTNAKALVLDDLIWKHYKVATLKVDSYSNIRWERKDWLTGKSRLSEIYYQNSPVQLNYSEYELTFENEVSNSQKDTRANRIERLDKAKVIPQETYSKSKVFIRNPDVVAEVLARANGVCDYCGQMAPFIKDTNGKGFLEVHHVVYLSKGGYDTIDNCAALCPNCHKHAHFGIKTFDLKKLKVHAIFKE
jgi:5-methylcytosine-specific restriction endonuclease McrA